MHARSILRVVYTVSRDWRFPASLVERIIDPRLHHEYLELGGGAVLETIEIFCRDSRMIIDHSRSLVVSSGDFESVARRNAITILANKRLIARIA